MDAKLTGPYKHYDRCRFCFSTDVLPVLDLGYMPLAGGFLRTEEHFKEEKNYPLVLNFCRSCYLLQSSNIVDAETLFGEYFYASSSMKTLIDHFNKKAEELKSIYPDANNRFVVEIGCNDGGFLASLKKRGFTALGVDPAKNIVDPLIAKGYPILNDFFTEKVGKSIVKNYQKADAVYSFHAMAHIEDMHDVVKGIKALLKPDGFLAFEVHYLGNLIKEFQYDMIYHEHEYYYSLLTLRKFFAQHAMEVFDVQPQSVRAGSMMYFVQHKKLGKRKVTENVRKYIRFEKEMGLHKELCYRNFSHYIQKTRKELVHTLQVLKTKKKRIIGYGASGRGTVIMNYCQLGSDILDFVVDDAPAKQGAFTPGNHLKIKNASSLYKSDYAILFAWPFLSEVMKRNQGYLQNGGKFIVPLPKVKIVGM